VFRSLEKGRSRATLREHAHDVWYRRGAGAAFKSALALPFGGAVPGRVVWGLSGLPGHEPLRTAPSSAGAESLADPFLRRQLAGRELGTWTLSAYAVGLLDTTVRRLRPELAVEFSSGVSTLVLAHATASSGGAPRVVSVEQDGAHVEATRGMLADAGLADAAVVLHAPLVSVEHDGVARSAYDLDPELLAHHIGGRAVGVAVVDGPAAETGARVTTAPALRPHLRGPCWLMLDDALREGELYAARWWHDHGLIERPRYVLREGGLMTATLLPA
jgi:hypothetical protein